MIIHVFASYKNSYVMVIIYQDVHQWYILSVLSFSFLSVTYLGLLFVWSLNDGRREL